MVMRGGAVLLATLAVILWPGTIDSADLEGRAYKNIVVELSANIVGENRKEVLDSVKELFAKTSAVLNKATGLHIGEVIFVCPQSWGPSEEWLTTGVVEATTRTQKNINADILLENIKESAFGKTPFALQNGGCGDPGLRITVPSDFVLDKDLNGKQKARLLSREWLKYRYGVFDEQGFLEDPRYPLYSRVAGAEDTELRMTDCTDEPVLYKFLDNENNNCSLKVTGDTGLPTESSCNFQADPEDNEKVTSSMMYLQSLPNVEYLCGDLNHPHDRRKPTKQNVMCDGRSVWDIMKEHSDLRNIKNAPPLTDEDLVEPPSFRYMQDRNLRMVLAMDINMNIGEPNRQLVNKATAKFVYDLPPSTQLGLLKFTENAVTVSQSVNPASMSQIIQSLSNKKISDESCSECALRKAIEMLDETGDPHGTIVLITSKDVSDDSITLWDNVKQEHCLEVILLPDATTQGLQKLVDKAGCGSIAQLQNAQMPEMLGQLFEFFEAITQRETPHQRKIKLKTSGNLDSDDPQVTFHVDSTVESLTMWLSSLNGDAVGMDESDVTLERVDETGTQVQWNVEQSRLFLVHKMNAIPGEWRYKLSVRQPLRVDITAVPKDTWKLLQVRIWTKETTVDTALESATQMPVVLYAEVRRGVDPIIDADVTAEITPPEDGASSVKFPLHDNGLGDPDVTKNDGIYSRYFTQFTTAGKYHVLITVKDNGEKAKVAKARDGGASLCCGSSLRVSNTETPTGKFVREAELYFSAKGGRPEPGYGPSRIFDLKVVSVTKPNFFTLQWTAPGGERDHGSVTNYTFTMSESYENASAFLDEEISNGFKFDESINPEPYGNIQKVTIDVSNEIPSNQTYFLAMRTFSSTGKVSKVSNIVEIFLSADFPTVTDETGSEYIEINATASAKTAGVSNQTIWIIVGVLIVLIIIVCIYVAVYFFYMKPKRRKEMEDKRARGKGRANEAPLEVPAHLNNSDDGTVPANEWKLDRDPISPVNSVPAQILLLHHEQVKDAKKKHKDPPLFKLENFQNNEEQSKPTLQSNGVRLNSFQQPPRQADEDRSTDSYENMQEDSDNSPATRHPPNSEVLYAKPPRRTTNV